MKLIGTGTETKSNGCKDYCWQYIFEFHNEYTFKDLEIKIQAQNSLERTWIEVVVDTTRHLGVETIIVGNGKHVLHSGIYTPADLGTQKVAEAVSQSDVIELQE
jgi:hypothetical protein